MLELPIYTPPSTILHQTTLLAGPQCVHLTLGVVNFTHESLPTAFVILHRLQTLLPLTAVPLTITPDILGMVLERESRRRAHVLWVNLSQPEPLFIQINQPDIQSKLEKVVLGLVVHEQKIPGLYTYLTSH